MDPLTGKTLWREEWRTDFDINASAPIASGDNLFITSSTGAMMFKVSAGGVQKAWKGPNREVSCKFQGAILDDGFLYANSEDKRGTIKCMAWPSGEIKWASKEADLKLDFGGSVLRVGNDRLISMSQKGVVSLVSATPQACKKISQFEPFDDNFDKDWATPLVFDGKLYVKGKDTLDCFDISGK